MEHHAICYVGIESAQATLAQHYAEHHPDVHVEQYAELGVREARSLRLRAAGTPLASTQHTFIIEAHRLTHEAQNALLKLFEDPPPRTQFYLVVPKRGVLIPTLQSRVFLVEPPTKDNVAASDSFTAFYSATLGERFDQAAKISKAKDLESAEAIVAGAEQLATKAQNEPLLHSVLLVRQYLGNRGASTKQLLEELALALPQQ